MVSGIFIGISIMLILFLCVFIGYQIGCKHKKAYEVEKLSKEEEEAFKKHVKGMENVLNYDYDVAIGRRANI